MPATIPIVQPCADFNTRSCTTGGNCAYLHGPDSFSVSTGGRNVCLAFLAKFPCAGCSYSHERHDVATLDDDELEPIVQQKVQEIQYWFTRTQQWSFSPAPVPFAQQCGYSQPQPPYPDQMQGQARHSTFSFANIDPSKVVEFKARGLQLATPTSPKSQESLAGVPNEGPAASVIDSPQNNAALEATVDLSNGDGWITPESNPDNNTEDKEPEEAEGIESNTKFDWAEDADRTLPISPQTRDNTPPTQPIVNSNKGKGKATPEQTAERDRKPSGTGGWDTPGASGWGSGWNSGWGEPKATSRPDASKEEPTVEITKEVADAWTKEYGLGGGGWDNTTTADSWGDLPKPSRDVHWDISPSNRQWDAKSSNENNWNAASKDKKSKSVAEKEKERSPPHTPKPKDKGNGFRKGPVEKDRKAWGKGWKEQGVIGSTTPWDGGKKEKKGGNPPMKEKHQAGPKDAFTFNRVSLASSSKHQGEGVLEPESASLPELPPDLKDKLPLEDAHTREMMENILRQGLVPKRKIPDRPSVAPLPESTSRDKGTNWVNGRLETGWDMDRPKDFAERKVQMDETSRWHPTRVKRTNSKVSPASGKEEESWPKLGK